MNKFHVTHLALTRHRVSQSLKNSTDTILSLKNLHQKCLQNMRKNIQRCAKMCKIFQKHDKIAFKYMQTQLN